MRRALCATIITIGLLATAMPGTAAATVRPPAGPALRVLPVGLVHPDGSATLFMLARCPAGLVVLEGFVTVTQDTPAGFADGIGGVNPACTGRLQLLRVSVFAPEPPFTRGEVSTSAFLLLIDPETQDTRSTDAGGPVRLVPRR